MIKKYEDMIAQPHAELARLAAALSLALSPDERDAALAIVSAIKPAEAKPPGGTTRYDRETLMHAGARPPHRPIWMTRSERGSRSATQTGCAATGYL